MANDGLITSFLGQGLAADRNPAPTIHPDAVAFWFSTDTDELSYWVEGAWIEDILTGGGGGGSLADGDYGDIVVSGSGTVLTVDTAAISLAKMANMATASLIYRKTAGSGVPEVNSLATLKTDLGLTGTNGGDQTITLTGNVTGTGTGSFATTIANSAVTLAMQANMATASVVYRKTAGAGAPEVNTLATLKTDLGLTGTNGGDQTITLTGDVTGSGTGSFAATIANSAVTLAKQANMATASVVYRKTAGSGAPEVQTLATLKTDLGLTGTNSGNQTSIVGITGSLAEFNTALTGADFASGGGTATGTNTGDQTSIVGITGSLSDFNTALTGDDFASGGGTATGTNTGDQTITLTGDVTGSGTGSFAATIGATKVTLAKIANAAANSKLLGSGDAGSGASYVELTVGSGLTMTGTTLSASGSYTDEQAQDAIGAMIDSSLTYVDATPLLQRAALTGDVTASAGSNATTIANSAVTLAKMADVATASVFYRKTAGTGAPEVNTLATLKTDLGLTGTNGGDQTITLTGDVTGSGTGSFAATIANDAVTYAKIQNVSATDRLLGRSTAGSGDVEEIVCTAAGRALIDDAAASNQRTTLGLGTAALLNITVSTSAPGSPATGDLWVDTN